MRALDTLIPCGRGQRLGIFAGSGVGKSSLLSMIARGTEAHVSVLALIGERGREVREFLERDLGPEGLARSVVVVATSDQPALVRLRAAFTATRIAEWFRDQGNDVVLMMDSLTRFAMAQREVGLSAGEPPATRGYPPSVFSLLPRLLERAGAAERGSITGLYTVLVDGDDMDEPIADCARSILDGHVVLSRRLATAGHFPTIEVLDSISRVAGAVTTPEQQAAAVGLRRLLAADREVKDLVEIGAYVPGTNPDGRHGPGSVGRHPQFPLPGHRRRRPRRRQLGPPGRAPRNEHRGGRPVKKYSFSLSKVLRVRRAEEDRAAAMLAAAQMIANAAAGREAQSRQALASRCARQGLQSAASFLYWTETTMLAGETLSDARVEAQRAEEDVAARRGDWSSAATRVSALEHLDERGREAHTLECRARRDQDRRRHRQCPTGSRRPDRGTPTVSRAAGTAGERPRHQRGRRWGRPRHRGPRPHQRDPGPVQCSGPRQLRRRAGGPDRRVADGLDLGRWRPVPFGVTPGPGRPPAGRSLAGHRHRPAVPRRALRVGRQSRRASTARVSSSTCSRSSV